MTYLSAQPQFTTSWDDICYPVNPVWLADLLPDYEIMATDKQQLIVGQPFHGTKTIFGIQSADYAIIPNTLIREVVDKLFTDYRLEIKYTTTGEFSIHIILAEQLSIGGEQLQRSMIVTNSYNGKTPFSVQGKTLTAMFEGADAPATSLYREVCQNGLIGWADAFSELPQYQSWLRKSGQGKEKRQESKAAVGAKNGASARKIHQSRSTPALFQDQLYKLLIGQNMKSSTLTSSIYEHLQQKSLGRTDEKILKTLPIPVQLAKQAYERLKMEQRLLNVDSSYWLLYNAVNHALFNARSSLTLNDRYKLDEKVFHQLAASSLT